MPIDIAAGLAVSKTALDIVIEVRKAIREKKKLTDEEMRDYLETLQDKLVAHSNDVDQSFQSDADQFGAKRRMALLV